MAQRRRIAILDDHDLVAAGIGALFAGDSSEFEVVFSGNSAADLIAFLTASEAAVDCVLLDVDLGVGNPAASAVVLALAELDTPALLVSALTHGRALREALAAGAAGYVGKSADPATLAAAVRAVCDGEMQLTALTAQVLVEVGSPDLSQQELAVLRLYATGLPQKTVARRLNVSNNTVGEYLKRIRRKYAAQGREVHTKQELYRAALDDELLSDSEEGG